MLVFVDGLGIPPPGGSALYEDACPVLNALIRDASVPLDAQLGVPGIPQSATGQTAIFTGVNAPRRIGGHQEGFPDAGLRDIIVRDNLFKRLRDAGRTCVFANAYVRMTVDRLPLAFRSVTTVMTLAALGRTQTKDDLLRGHAVYHDVTRESTREHDLLDIPLVDEKQAAGHLLTLMRTVDFCLFEFFLTDHEGHRGTAASCRAVLQKLDRFLGAVIQGLDRESELFLLVSDHGNIEEPHTRVHTSNPVPWIAVGCAEDTARHDMTSLLDVTPRILELLSPCPR